MFLHMCNTPQNVFSLLCNREVQYCCISYLLTTPLGPDNLCLVDPSILKPSDPALDLCPNPSPLQTPRSVQEETAEKKWVLSQRLGGS